MPMGHVCSAYGLGGKAAGFWGAKCQCTQGGCLRCHGAAAVRWCSIHGLQTWTTLDVQEVLIILGVGGLKVRRAVVGLLVHGPELVVVEIVVHEWALHSSSLGCIRIHLAHLARMAHGNPIPQIHAVTSLHAILAAELQIEQLIGTDSGVPKVEARRKILLGGERIGHETTVLHVQIGGVDALIGVSKLIRHRKAGIRHGERIKKTIVLVRFILDEDACFGHCVTRCTGRTKRSRRLFVRF